MLLFKAFVKLRNKFANNIITDTLKLVKYADTIHYSIVLIYYIILNI